MENVSEQYLDEQRNKIVNLQAEIKSKDQELARLREALEYLINDIRRKPNDTRYLTAIRKASEALNSSPKKK